MTTVPAQKQVYRPTGTQPSTIQEFYNFAYILILPSFMYPWRHFYEAVHAYGAAQNSFIHSCMILHGRIFDRSLGISFQYQDRYHLLNFRYRIILCNTGIAKILIVFLQHLHTDSESSTNKTLCSYVHNKLPTYFK